MTATLDSVPVSLPAAGDLRSKLFRFGKDTSSGINVCSVAGERADCIIGAHQKNNPVAGDAVDVYLDRIMLVEAGAAFARGVALASDADGRAVTATGNAYVNAYALEAATAAGQYVRCWRPVAASPVLTNVANANVLAGAPAVHQFEIADAASADYDIVITNKFEVLDVIVQKTGANGGAANTVQIKSGASAISDAISININDQAQARSASLNDANSVIAAGGTLRASIVKAGGNAACKVTVLGIPRA